MKLEGLFETSDSKEFYVTKNGNDEFASKEEKKVDPHNLNKNRA